MWVYIDNWEEGKKVYTVGFFRGTEFYPSAKYENERLANDRVHYLNGGNTAAIKEAATRITKAIDSLKHEIGL